MRNVFKTFVWIVASLFACVGRLFSASRPAALILMYHSFEDTKWKYGVRPKELERQIEYKVEFERARNFDSMYGCKRMRS